MNNDPDLILDLPAGKLRSSKHSLVIRPYLFGQYRLQLMDVTKFDPHASEGHGSIVREMCTYKAETAFSVARQIANEPDPEAFCRTFEEKWNCERPGFGRIRLDEKIEDHPEMMPD